MSFDGLFTYAMTNELQHMIETGRISKIYQPSKYEILLHIRAKGKNHKLLLCAHPSYARVHVTEHTYESPSVPPMFCMLLRKHIEGGIIEEIRQLELERIVELRIRSRNELGDESSKRLLIEIMGRHSNIILTDEDGKILDSLKHLSAAVNRHRTVLPGFAYVAPPAQNKRNPLHIQKEEEIIQPLDFLAGKMDQQLIQTFAGISPIFAKEIIKQANLVNERTLPRAFLTAIEPLKSTNISAQMIISDDKEYFYMLPLSHIHGERKSFATLSELLDRFFFGKAERDRVKQQTNDLEKFLSNELAKNKKKQKKLQQSLVNAEKADYYQRLGELVTANIYAIKRGDKQVEVSDYYDENGATITIPLNPLKSPADNAQSYFHKYQKTKKSIVHIHEQLEKNDEEIVYLDSLVQQMETASPKDAEEIREELAEEGYIKARAVKKQKKQTKPVLDEYTSTDGTTILVGKNNKQNEYVTNKVASRDDIWLHTKDIPGSHVVIRTKEPSEQTLIEAAHLAAYFSKSRNSSSVPVDYTAVRHVKKPSGSKPGFVTYTNQQTIYITPDADLVLQLKKLNSYT
jgi:predicted ribosome quality control (RQC) complex YloA/Tae2 family protein